MKYVLSTMTGGVCYAFYENGPAGGLPIERKSIRISGGAHLPNSTSPFGELSNDPQGSPMWTPAGVVTPVRDEDYEELKNHRLFQQHMKNGFLKIVDYDITDNHKAVAKEAKSLETADNSTQLTPTTAKKVLGKTAPKVRIGDANDEDLDLPKARIKG